MSKRKHGAGILSLAMCLAACQAAPPIVLHPQHAQVRPVARRQIMPRAVVPNAAGPEGVTACERPVASLSRAEQESMFRQFEASQSQSRVPMAAPPDRLNGICRPAG